MGPQKQRQPDPDSEYHDEHRDDDQQFWHTDVAHRTPLSDQLAKPIVVEVFVVRIAGGGPPRMVYRTGQLACRERKVRR
jgi:hypothetical protein